MMVNLVLESHSLPLSVRETTKIKKTLLSHPIVIEEFTAPKQTKLFQQLKQEQFSGQLILRDNQGREFFFYLYLGRILYAAGGIHPVRRWYRHLATFCPQLVANPTAIQEDIAAISLKNAYLPGEWEYQALCLWVKQEKITREQLTKIISSMIREILFDLTQSGQVSYYLNPDKCLSLVIAPIDSEQLIVATWKQWQAWQEAKLADRSPNKTLLIKNPEQLQLRTSPFTYQILTERLNGENSLRDLATLLKQDLLFLTRSLMSYVEGGLMELVDIADLPAPFSLSQPSPAKRFQPKLIAFIYDNPILCQLMEKIVLAAGHQFISANNGLQALALCLSQKPDLIFLDLLMPKGDSYNLCSQLRQIPVFQKTPIVLLTENNSIMDRFRAKMIGCKEILYKPINRDHILRVISKYLEPEAVA